MVAIDRASTPRSQLPLVVSGIASLVGGITGLGVAILASAYYSWFAAATLAGLIIATLGPLSVRLSLSGRVTVFLGLLSVADFLKRLVFMLPDQYTWSQYLVWVLPHVYYIFFVLLPWLYSDLGRVRHAVRASWPVAVFMALALLATWLAPGFPVTGRLAATVLLIMPWTMVFVSGTTPDALIPVCKVLAIAGVVNALYGLWQFALGSTIVELRWALETSEFSIGAQHLARVVEGSADLPVWRIIGLQADTLTFGLFLITGVAAAWMLRRSGYLSATTCLLFGATILAGVAASLGRSVWVSATVLVTLGLLAAKARWVLHPKFVLAIMIASFVVADLLASLLATHYAWLASSVEDPRLRLVLRLGTLGDRIGALKSVAELLSSGWIFGVGYAASEWIGAKFGTSLPPNFGRHNALIELLWYTGPLGVTLFLVTLYRAHAAAYREPAGVQQIMAAYLMAMFTSGLASGGGFLNYYYFFFLGSLLKASKSHRRDSANASQESQGRSRRSEF